MNDREEEKYYSDKNACSNPSYDLHATGQIYSRTRTHFLSFFFFFFNSLPRIHEYNEQESRRVINTNPGTIASWKEMLNPP